ncbi:MAG: hypothetical protein K0B87_00765 [Candidatus Syntrophosphaera sp.]|nr:hypothetical protein [Candidatus Syntrophosphaera sp.]
MMKQTLALLMVMAPLLLSAWANYTTLSTPDFEVYFRKGWETEAKNILQALEFSRPYVESLTGHRPARVPVVLSDMGIMVNGYANPVGAKMGLFAYPPSSGELALGEDWWQFVGVHEYIHMAQMTRTSGEPALLRALFGNILYPNLYQPMWMTEGITVYGESQLSEYTGRLNSGTYPAIINALAREGRLPSPGKACYYSHSDPLGNYYVYGSSFHQYLSDTYGEDKFAVLYGETSASLTSYLNPLSSSLSLDRSYKTAFGKSVSELWSDWQAQTIDRSTPLPKQKLTEDGWTKKGLTHHNGALYYIQRKTAKTGPSSGFSSYRLMRLNGLSAKASAEVVIEQGSDFTAGYQISGNKLYYSRSEFKPGYANNDFDGLGIITEVWVQDLSRGNRKKLFAGPIRAFCHLGGNRFLVAEDDETHQNTKLYEISGSAPRKTLRGTLDHLVGTIHASQGRIFVTARRFWQNNSIYELNLNTLALTPLVNTASLETVSWVGGNDLAFNAVYDGKNGAYIYKLDSGEIQRLAGFSEIKDAVEVRGKTYFLSINAQGYDVYQDPLKLQSFSLPQAKTAGPSYTRLSASSSRVLNKYPIQAGSYAKNIGHMLWPRLYRFPYIDATDKNGDGELDELIVGVQMAGTDVVGDFPMWYATVLYDVKNEDWGFNLGLENNFFSPVKHTLEYSDLDGKSLKSVQYVPLLRRQNYGLTEARAGFGFTASENMARQVWDPFVGLNFAARGARLQTKNSLLIETDKDRLGWQGLANLRWKAPLSTEFRHSVFAAHDPKADPDEVFAPMRGYESDWNQTRGVQLSNSWYAPILKIRDGIWNPNIYIEDVNLGLFYDHAFPGDKVDSNVRYSYGAELIAEFSLLYNFSLNLGVRYSQNKEGEELVALILGL